MPSTLRNQTSGSSTLHVEGEPRTPPATLGSHPLRTHSYPCLLTLFPNRSPSAFVPSWGLRLKKVDYGRL